MLNTQKQFLQYLGKLDTTLNDIPQIENKFQVEELKQQIDQKELLVPVVGGFSAGKSTLINSFLGDKILPTALTPETALATELRYSQENCYKAYKSDGSYDRFDITDIESIKQNAKSYTHLRLYLDNQRLKDIEPLILVDMPGFDSPLELHNQAIMNYLNKGIYFVILTSIEDGNITKSIIREIHNILEFGKDFSFCLSKTNLRPKDDIVSVQENMQEQIELEFDLDKDVILLDDNGGENLDKILSSIDTEKLFKSIFISELKNQYFDIESAINTTISTLKTSKDEATQTINELKSSVDKLMAKKETMILEAQQRYSTRGVDSIVNAVASEITANQDTLVNLALSNSQAFSSEINNIVKTRLISEIKSKVQNISLDIVDDFSVELKDLQLKDFHIDQHFVEQIANSTKDILQKTQSGLETLLKTTSKKGGGVYKTITTILSVTTAVLNPIVEIILIFLPDIIEFFAKSSREQKARNEVITKLHSQIIPELKIKIKSELTTLFQEQVNNLIETISNEFEDKLKQKQEEINNAMKQKEENISNIQESISSLETARKNLQTLANSYIFKA